MAEQTTTALDVVPLEDRNLRGLQIARSLFTDEDRNDVAGMLGVSAESPALLPFLALCVAEGFSPWANHVWLIPKRVRIKGADGQEWREEEKHVPMVGRDGLLHKYHEAKAAGVAKRLSYGTVCERDSFDAWFDDREDRWRVTHRQATKPTEQVRDGEPIAKWRGAVIGGWALLKMADGETHYFFAPMAEYARLEHVWAYSETHRRRMPLFHDPRDGRAGHVTFEEVVDGARCQPVQEYEGAWDYESSMALKGAQSYVCRIGLGVTGFVPADELRDVEAWQAETGAPQSEPAATNRLPVFDFTTISDDSGLVAEIKAAVDEANELVAHSWSAAKCEMVLSGRNHLELRGIIGQLRRENEAARVRLAPKDAAAALRDPAAAARADELRQMGADLLGALDHADGDEKARLRAALDGVEAELRDLGEEV